jgi:hypothetical protein
VQAYTGATGRAAKTEILKNYVSTRMLDIDTQYLLFEQQLYEQNVKGSVYTAWTLLGLAFAGVAVSSSQDKEWLAALSAGILGGKAAFDKNALFDKTITALIIQMNATRKTVKLRILESLRDQENNKIRYTMIEAVGDVKEYYQAGSIPAAIGALTEGATNANAVATEELKAFKSGFIKDPAGDRLRVFWKPDGKTTNTANAKRITDECIATLSDPDLKKLSITSFLRSNKPEIVEARLKCADTLAP